LTKPKKFQLKNTATTTNLLKRFIEGGVAGAIALVIIFGGVFVGESAPIPLIYNREPEEQGLIYQGHWRDVHLMGPFYIDFSEPPEEPIEEPPEEPIVIPSAAERRDLERRVGERINLYRTVWDLPPLQLEHDRLNDVARYRAHEIAQSFSRYRPDGTNPFVLYPAFNAASENISRGPTTPHGLMNVWMVSVNHREAIFDYHNHGFDAVGVGLYVNAEGEHFWVAIFIKMRTPEEGEVTQEELDEWWERNRPDEERPEA